MIDPFYETEETSFDLFRKFVQVLAKLTSGGFNINDAIKMIDKHFDYAYEKYGSVKYICECISTLGK